MENKYFDYDDVQLIPKCGIIDSRSECDTSVTLGKHTFNLPIVPANMKSVIDVNLAIELAKRKQFYIMHRFLGDGKHLAQNSEYEAMQLYIIQKMKNNNLISSISIGVKEADFHLIKAMASHDLIPDYITIDIAHGHSLAMRKTISALRDSMGDKTFIIAGNICTPNAAIDLVYWGASCSKIGVGPGSPCTTRLKTGFGSYGWQLSAIKECASAVAGSSAIIADGGIKHNGDIAKAIALGADMVMLGGMLAGYEESPGAIKEDAEGNLFKEFYGSASAQNKIEHKNIEGLSKLVPLKGSIFDKYQEIKEDLSSSISYAGGKKLLALRDVGYIVNK